MQLFLLDKVIISPTSVRTPISSVPFLAVEILISLVFDGAFIMPAMTPSQQLP